MGHVGSQISNPGKILFPGSEIVAKICDKIRLTSRDHDGSGVTCMIYYFEILCVNYDMLNY